MKPKFTNPKISKTARGWYVHYRYEGKQFREIAGLNKIEDLEKREAKAIEICRLILVELKSGWNPNIPISFSETEKMNIVDAIKFALDKKSQSISKRTLVAYKSTTDFFIKAVKDLKLSNVLITDIKRIHIKTILERIKKNRKWSDKSYNKNLGYLKAIIGELLQWDILEYNPVHGIKTIKIGEVIANIPATDEQVILIKEKLLSDFPSFYIYVISIFHTGIRPEELLKLKINMIDLPKNQIILPAEITKTQIERIVPVNNYLKDYFEKMNIYDYDQDYYLFGSKREHSNRGLKKDLDFIPGPTMLNRDCASKLWRKLIKDDLGIDVNMYSMKHLGANKKILAGIDIDALRELYGHTSKMMTLRYAKIVKEVNRNQILEKSPDF